MKIFYKMLAITALILTIGSIAHAQEKPSGDEIVGCLNKPISDAGVERVLNAYEMEDDLSYVKAGKGLTFFSPDGYVQRIGFQNNKIYGSFKGKLPYGLNFHDSIRDLKQKFPDGELVEDYFKCYTGNHQVEIKFSSPAKKKIEFIAVH